MKFEDGVKLTTPVTPPKKITFKKHSLIRINEFGEAWAFAFVVTIVFISSELFFNVT